MDNKKLNRLITVVSFIGAIVGIVTFVESRKTKADRDTLLKVQREIAELDLEDKLIKKKQRID